MLGSYNPYKRQFSQILKYANLAQRAAKYMNIGGRRVIPDLRRAINTPLPIGRYRRGRPQPRISMNLSNSSAPSYTRTLTRRKKKRSRRDKRASLRKAKLNRKIRKIAQSQPPMGRVLVNTKKTAGTISNGINECSYNIVGAATSTTPEQWVIGDKAELQGLIDNEYTIVTAAGAEETTDLSVTNSNVVLHWKQFGKLDLVNNYAYPVEVVVYHLAVRVPYSGENPKTWTEEGLTNLNVTSSSTNICYYARHSRSLLKMHKVEKASVAVIKPGEHATYFIKTSGRVDKNSIMDSNYPSSNRNTKWFLVRMQGSIGHNLEVGVPDDDVGYTAGKLDCVFTRKSVFRHEGMRQVTTFKTLTSLGNAEEIALTRAPKAEEDVDL